MFPCSALHDQVGTDKAHVSVTDSQAFVFMYMEACPDAQPAFVPYRGAYAEPSLPKLCWSQLPQWKEKDISGCARYTAQLWI